jgi:hypothetical protein
MNFYKTFKKNFDQILPERKNTALKSSKEHK